MKPRHIVLATFIAVIWGLAYVATGIALDDFSPPQLTALHFLIAYAPILFLPRLAIPWGTLVSNGLTMFARQFLLQFFGIANGIPPGLASVVSHTQRMFTVLLAIHMTG
jgi:O-acetylserine/cysteine efflux transporter